MKRMRQVDTRTGMPIATPEAAYARVDRALEELRSAWAEARAAGRLTTPHGTPIPRLTLVSPPPDPKPLRVLYIEDEPLVASAVADCLRRDGHDVVTVASGEEAAALPNGWDVIVVDLNLGRDIPEWWVVGTMKRSYPHARIVVYTGLMLSSREEEIAQSWGSAAIAYKPETSRLREAVRGEAVTLRAREP